MLLNRSGDTLVACPAGKTSVVIPEGVTTIGISAFKGCDKLQSIQLPATLKTIASYAFRNCSSMPNITIPDNTTSIGHGAFVYCDKLENVSFGQGVTQISSLAFADCKSLKEVAFPANLTSLQEWDTFARCPQLAKVVIPETVKKIEYSNFSGSPLVKIYGKTNSFAQTYANSYSIPFVSLGIVEGTTEPALRSFIGKDLSGNYYKYQADDFNNAYLAYQYNPELTAAKMYQQFLNGKCKIIALEDAAKGYLDYDAAGSASLLAQINNQPFDLLAYFASADAKLLQETITNIKIVDKDGNTN